MMHGNPNKKNLFEINNRSIVISFFLEIPILGIVP